MHPTIERTATPKCSPLAVPLLSALTILLAACGPGDASMYGEDFDDVAGMESDLTAPTGSLRGVGGNCLDASNFGTTNGTTIHMWDCHGGSNQQWRVGPVGTRGPIKAANGKCLDVASGGSISGAKVQLWSCHGGSNQQWTLTSQGTLEGVGGKCLDVWGGSTSNGARVSMYTCHGRENQKWRFSASTGTTTEPTEPTTPAPTSSEKLSFRPPALTNPTTIHISNADRTISLDTTRDYILKMPSTPITGLGGLSISGGRNVVMIGGEIRHDVDFDSTNSHRQRGLQLKSWTGTMHVEGLLIAGSRLHEGINIDTRAPGAILQLQNIRVEKVQGSYAGHHADVLQNWAGPTEYRIDRLTGYTNYQGMMVQPEQFGSPTRLNDWRRMDLHAVGSAGYMIYMAGSWPTLMTQVYLDSVDGDYTYQSGHNRMGGYIAGKPPTGEFVPAGVAGIHYVSPGYL